MEENGESIYSSQTMNSWTKQWQLHSKVCLPLVRQEPHHLHFVEQSPDSLQNTSMRSNKQKNKVKTAGQR